MKLKKKAWDRYYDLRLKKIEIDAQMDEVKAELVEHADQQSLWKGKTATFANGLKVSYYDKIKVVKPSDFDADLFLIHNPAFAKMVIDKRAIQKAMQSSEETQQILEENNLKVIIEKGYKF